MNIIRSTAMAVLGAALCATTAVIAQQPAHGYAVPKTPWGDPDLQGKWPGTELVGVPLQRDPKFGTRNVLTDEEFKARQEQFAKQKEVDDADFDPEHPVGRPGDVGSPTSPPPHWLERGTPQYIASLIVDPPDGRLPAPAPGAPRGGGFRTEEGARSYTDLSNYVRCITRGVPGSMLPVIYNNGNEIIQAPGYVVLRNEMIHETRVVPLDGRPHPDPRIKMWMGDSRGHWDGDTLVVETTNFDPRTGGVGGNGGGRVSDELKITERITRIAADRLVWRMTIDDPKTWTRPFTIELPLKRDDDYGMFEYACHEGNYALRNILTGSAAQAK